LIENWIETDTALVVTSDKVSKRFEVNQFEFSSSDEDPEQRYDYIVDETKTFQELFGFGGAFTDSAGFNIALLDNEAQDKLIEAYYDPTGLDYSIGRVNMGGCDFSTR
jgi:glucosylceramidase